MGRILIHSRERLGNLFICVASGFGSFLVALFTVYQILYLTPPGYKQKEHCFYYAGVLCTTTGSIAIYDVFMCCKHYSSPPERSEIRDTLYPIGFASLILMIVNLVLRTSEKERLNFLTDFYPSGSVLKMLRVHKWYVLQVMLAMVTIVLWAKIKAEVFTGVEETGKVHGLLFLTDYFGAVPMMVQYHPELDIQHGILALAVLNLIWVLVLFVVHVKDLNTSRTDGSTQTPRISPRKIGRNKWRKGGGSSGLSSARSRADSESPLLPRIPSV